MCTIEKTRRARVLEPDFDNQTHGVTESGISVERKVTTVIRDNTGSLHTGYTIQHGKTRIGFTDANWTILKRLMAELEGT